MYTVITCFADLLDHNHKYNVGDLFPRIGADYEVTKERLEELSTRKNKRGIPLIKNFDNEPSNLTDKPQNVESDINTPLEDKKGKNDEIESEKKTTYTKTKIMKMSKAELVALAKENGIKKANEKSGAELKSLLISKLA